MSPIIFCPQGRRVPTGLRDRFLLGCCELTVFEQRSDSADALRHDIHHIVGAS